MVALNWLPETIQFHVFQDHCGVFGASARSIAFSAAINAADLLGSCPMISTPATDADQIQTPRSTPSITAYSIPRYCINPRKRQGTTERSPDAPSERPHARPVFAARQAVDRQRGLVAHSFGVAVAMWLAAP